MKLEIPRAALLQILNRNADDEQARDLPLSLGEQVIAIKNRKGRTYSVPLKCIEHDGIDELLLLHRGGRLIDFQNPRAATDYVRLVFGRKKPSDQQLETAKRQFGKIRSDWATMGVMVAERVWKLRMEKLASVFHRARNKAGS